MSGGARPRRRKAQSTGQKDGDDGSGSDDAPDNMLGARSSITTNPRFLVSHMAHTTYTVDYGVTDSCSVVHNLGFYHFQPEQTQNQLEMFDAHRDARTLYEPINEEKHPQGSKDESSDLAIPKTGSAVAVKDWVQKLPRVPSYRKILDPATDNSTELRKALDEMTASKDCPIDPESQFKTIWNVILTILVVILVWETPIVVAFSIHSAASIVISSITDLYFIADLILNFFTGYVDRNRRIIMDRKSARIQYLRTWFAIDLLASIPWGIISLITSNDKHAMFTMIKLVRLVSVRHLISRIRTLNTTVLTWFRLFLMFISYLCWLNFLACMWFYICVNSDGQYPFMNDFQDPAVLFTQSSVWTQYTYSIYYIVVTVITIGYGDITPNTLGQKWFAIWCMILQGFIDSFIFGYVIMLVSLFYQDNIQNISKIRQVAQYVQNNNIPKPIEDRVWHYMVHKDELRARFDANHVFAGYPRHLMKEIKLYAHHEKLARLLGTDIPMDVLMLIATKLQWTYCVEGEQWVEAGLYGNHAFYLQRGAMNVYHGGCCIRRLEGPADLWYGGDLLYGPPKKHPATFEATEDCDLFVLTRNDFNEVIKELPFLKDRIERNLGQLAMDVHQLPGFVQSEDTYDTLHKTGEGVSDSANSSASPRSHLDMLRVEPDSPDVARAMADIGPSPKLPRPGPISIPPVASKPPPLPRKIIFSVGAALDEFDEVSLNRPSVRSDAPLLSNQPPTPREAGGTMELIELTRPPAAARSSPDLRESARLSPLIPPPAAPSPRQGVTPATSAPSIPAVQASSPRPVFSPLQAASPGLGLRTGRFRVSSGNVGGMVPDTPDIPPPVIEQRGSVDRSPPQ